MVLRYFEPQDPTLKMIAYLSPIRRSVWAAAPFGVIRLIIIGESPADLISRDAIVNPSPFRALQISISFTSPTCRLFDLITDWTVSNLQSRSEIVLKWYLVPKAFQVEHSVLPIIKRFNFFYFISLNYSNGELFALGCSVENIFSITFWNFYKGVVCLSVLNIYI